MSLYLEVAGVLAAASALLYYVGYGLGKIFLPDDLKEFEGLLTPFVGFAVIVFVGYYSVNTVLNLSVALWVILGLATVANAYAIMRRPRGLRFDWKSEATLLAMAGAVFALGVLPLLHYGYSTVIGESWDVEFYLPLAEFLKTYPQTALSSAPANSAIQLLTTPPTSGRGMGLTYFHSLISLIAGWNALSTFALVLSAMRALSLFPVYVFARKTLGLGRWAGLVAALFFGLSEPLLWLTYNSFAMHVGSLGLLPLLLVSTQVALTQRDYRSVGFAGFVLASLAVTYHPALTAYAILGAAMGAYYLFAEKHRADLLKAAGGVVGSGLALSFLAQARFPDGFLGPYGDRVTSLGIVSFAPLSDLYGLSFFFPLMSGRSLLLDLGAITGEHFDGVATVLTALAVALSLFGLWKTELPRRRLALALAAAGAAYLLIFRFVTRSQYEFFKGAAFLSFVLWALVAVGLARLWATKLARSKLLVRTAAVVCAALLVASLGFNTALLVGQYWVREPPLYGPETQELVEIANLLPPGASVYVTGDPTLPKSYMGLVSYYLEGHETYGYYSTGFGNLRNPSGNRPPDYALLSSSDDPTVLGYQPASLIRQGERLRLYQKDPTLLAQFGPVKDDDSPAITGGQSKTLTVLPDDIVDREQAVSASPAQKRQLTLALATFVRQSISLQIGRDRRVVDLPPGLTEYTTGAVDAPVKVSIRGQGDQPVYLRWMALRTAQGEETSAQVQRNEVFYQSHSVSGGDKARTSLKLATPALGTGSQIIKLRASLDGRLATTREQVKIGQWEFWAGTSDDIQIETDLKGRGVSVQGDGKPLEVRGHGQAIPDGWYSFSLGLVRQNAPMGSRQIFLFQVKNGQIVNPEPDDAVLNLVHLPVPQHDVGLILGDSVDLLGYTLDKAGYRPGDDVKLTLSWRGLRAIRENYVVSVGLIDDQGRRMLQVGAQPDGGRYPTSGWPSGEIVQDSVQLKLPDDAREGRYQVEVGLYEAGSGRWLLPKARSRPDGRVPIGEVTVAR